MDRIQLNLGGGGYLPKDWITVDGFLDYTWLKRNRPEFVEEGAIAVQGNMKQLPFLDSVAEYIECIEAIEHLGFKEFMPALSEIRRVLSPEGKFLVVTSDFSDMCRQWLEMEDRIKLTNKISPGEFAHWSTAFYGNQIHNGEYHKSAWTAVSLRSALEESGFKVIRMERFPIYGSWPECIKSIRVPSDARLNITMISALAMKGE